MRKSDFCIFENKIAYQLCGNKEAGYIDCTIALLPQSQILSLYPSSVSVQLGLCLTWSKPAKTGFLATQLICSGGYFS